jgi:RNA polymerase sigma-70 factor, ECF subfamily
MIEFENEVIRRAGRGEAAAIRILYERYAAHVYSVVRRLAGDDATAEDWAQDAWIRALRSLPGFRGEARFSTWIHRIAVNCALQGQRSRQRRERREEPGDEPVTAGGDERALLRLRLEEALQRLPAGMREVLVLHDVEGFTHEEIAGMLQIAAGTSKSQLFRARARMRQLLEPASAHAEMKEGRTSWNT